MAELESGIKEDFDVQKHDGNSQDLFSPMKTGKGWGIRKEDEETEASAKSRDVSGEDFKEQDNSKDEAEGTSQNPRRLFGEKV